MARLDKTAEFRDETARVRERFERLLAAGVAIYGHHDLPHVLQQVVDAAREVVGARYAALGVLDESRTGLVQFVTSGLDDDARRRIGDLPRGRGLLGHVIEVGKTIRTADISTHPQRSGFPPHHPPMKSFLGVPVKGPSGTFGNLYLTEKIGAPEFDDEDEAIAVLLATQAAAAVENARLHEQSEELVAKIQALQRQRDLFFAMMNHELRNALTGVYGWAERLVRKKSPESVEQASREVYEAAERTITLLNNFLDLTRLDAGKIRPVVRPVNAVDIAHRAVMATLPAAESRRVQLQEDWGASALTVRTDPMLLEQILVNLLSNAVRHSPERGTVVVGAERTGDVVLLHVSDQGPGIDPALHVRIFEPFERFDPSSGLGTGLGLPVSRRLAEVLGGTLVVRSDIGTGACFTLALPDDMKDSS
ncbi:MAG: GAF domain-containing sensor histidine kinase [Gemmatimonadales bacterium]|nr:GAF domain-containing sensor histidine kinase [Gemmatimonadales bacterium]